MSPLTNVHFMDTWAPPSCRKNKLPCALSPWPCKPPILAKTRKNTAATTQSRLCNCLCHSCRRRSRPHKDHARLFASVVSVVLKNCGHIPRAPSFFNCARDAMSCLVEQKGPSCETPSSLDCIYILRHTSRSLILSHRWLNLHNCLSFVCFRI